MEMYYKHPIIGAQVTDLRHKGGKAFLSGIPGSNAAAGLSVVNFVRSIKGVAKTPFLSFLSLNYTIQSKLINAQLKTILMNYMENKNQNGIYFTETYKQSNSDPHFGIREWSFYDSVDDKYLGSLCTY